MILTKNPRKKQKILVPLLLIFAVCIISDYLYFRNRIYPGVMLKDISLGGLPLAEIEDKLKDTAFTFTGPGGTSVFLPLKDLGIFFESGTILSSAYRQGRHKGWPLSYYERYIIKREGAFVSPFFQVEREALIRGINGLEDTFNTEPENAFFLVDEKRGKVQLIPERSGFLLKKDELEKQFLRSLGSLHTPFSLQVPLEELPPGMSTAAFLDKGIETLMSSFSTSFDPSQEGRVHNIKLASSHFHCYFVKPGEVVSLNRIIGDTTRAKGYQEAPIIVGGRLVPGVGGGLCQVSGTLYNAALLADLQIIERHCHRLAVPYIPPGRDATISYGAKDLKFRNNKEHYILINAIVEENRLTFRIFGAPMEKRIRISVNILDTRPPPVRYELDPSLPPGEEEITFGLTGYTVEVWRTVYVGDAIEQEEMISMHHYSPYPSIIRRGPS